MAAAAEGVEVAAGEVAAVEAEAAAEVLRRKVAAAVVPAWAAVVLAAADLQCKAAVAATAQWTAAVAAVANSVAQRVGGETVEHEHIAAATVE
jgi:hypothetical protein